MTKSLLNLTLTAFSLLVFSNLGFAGSCNAEISDKAETPVKEVAEAKASKTDDLLPGCCAAAFAELARPADETTEGLAESEKITEIAKADPSQPEGCTAKNKKTGECSAADMATCEQKKSCSGTVESDDSKAFEKQDS